MVDDTWSSSHLWNERTRNNDAIKELNIFELYKDDKTDLNYEDDLHTTSKWFKGFIFIL